MSAEALFDFEVIVPTAVAAVLKDAGLEAFTISDKIEFQKKRPRVEIIYQHQGEATPKRLAVLSDGSKRTSCFRGLLKIHAITDADTQGKIDHSTYRAKVRAALSNIQDTINGETLTLHKIQFVITGNEETGVRSADGYQQTTFPFTIDISIQQNAWEEL